MNLGTLEEFIALVRYSNFSDASRQLNISQPALSKHLAQLEKELRCSLITRDTRNFSLTPQGEIFYETAVATINTFNAGINRLNTHSRSYTVEIAGIAQSPAAGRFLAQLGQAEPRANIKLNPAVKLPFEVALAERRVDAFISPMVHSVVEHLTSLEFIPIAEECVFAIVSSESDLRDKDAIGFDDLSDVTFIHASSGFNSEPGWQVIEELCKHAGFNPKSRIIFQESPLSLKNDEVLILPQFEADNLIRQYGTDMFRSIPIRDHYAKIILYLIINRNHRSPQLDSFVESARKLSPPLSG